MNENKVENYKIIGLRDMNMNADLKALFYHIDSYSHPYKIKKPYFNDAKETFKIDCSDVDKEFYFEDEVPEREVII